MDSNNFKNRLIGDIKKNIKFYFLILLPYFFVYLACTLGKQDWYTCDVKLVAELGEKSKIMAAADMIYGMQVSLNDLKSPEPVRPKYYPEIINSNDFRAGLLNVKVQTETDSDEITYFDYLANKQKEPWWKSIFIGKKDEVDMPIDLFRLTKSQASVVSEIGQRVSCSVERKTNIITISVKDPNPYVCALISDSVQTHLQDYIVAFLTNKYRKDLNYFNKMSEKIELQYKKAVDNYVTYSDSHQNSELKREILHQEYLEDEMNMFGRYKTEFESKKIQTGNIIQENVPAFTTLQKATVPLKPSITKFDGQVISDVFFIIVLVTLYIFYKEGEMKTILGYGNKAVDEHINARDTW